MARVLDEIPWLKQRRHPVHIHVVFKSSRNSAYPINFLRNVAISNVQTSHVFLCDVDFVPMPQLHEKLVKAVFEVIPKFPQVLSTMRFTSRLLGRRSKLCRVLDLSSKS